ncbi:MAG: TonB-dependent receptor, partial [Pseudomonadota bacterium]
LGESDVNDTRIFGGRFAARWSPNDLWTLDAVAGSQDVEADDGQYVAAELGGLTKAANRREAYDDRFRFGSVTASGPLAGGDVTSATAATFRRTETAFDASAAFPFLFEDPAEATPIGAPGTFDSAVSRHGLIHESRFTSSNSANIKWLLGVFAAARWTDTDTLLRFDRSPETDLVEINRRRDRSIESAVFADGDWAFSRRWTATLGARVSLVAFRTDVDLVRTAPPDDLMLQRASTDVSFAPRMGVTYRLSEGAAVYAQATRGFRNGGFNVNSPPQAVLANPDDNLDVGALDRFASDRLWSGELGFKFASASGRAVLNAAAFLVSWQDIQADVVPATGIATIVNAGDARIWGIEAETRAKVQSWLDLSAAVTWTDTTLLNANPFVSDAPAGLPVAPDLTAYIRAEVNAPVADWTARAAVDYRYIGESELTFDSADRTQGGVSDVSADIWVERGGVSFGVFIDNALNTRDDTFAFGNPFSFASEPQATPLRPRTIGLSATIDFG